jgi:LysR family hydrogen peroxide-inducible transcriptional activator
LANAVIFCRLDFIDIIYFETFPMTLTELRYIVALSREKHFGKAAAACFVSQPSLSVGIKKIEQELGVTLFERSLPDVHLTPVGERVVAQAQRVLNEVELLKTTAQDTDSHAAGILQLGMIYSVAPYLLPKLMPELMAQSRLQVLVQEDFTHKLLERVKNGTLDAAIVALPISDAGLTVAPLYDEDFYVALPNKHRLAQNPQISTQDLSSDALLVLGAGHCFRDQVLLTNPNISTFKVAQDGLQQTFAGTSLETLRHMAAGGFGITVLPALAVPNHAVADGLSYIPFAPPAPKRQVVLVWRSHYSRQAACEYLAQLIARCGVRDAVGVHAPA